MLGRSPRIDPSPAGRYINWTLFVALTILQYCTYKICMYFWVTYRWWITSWELGSWVYPSKISLYRSQIHSPWLGDMVDSGIGLSYRPVSLCSQAGRYDHPRPELTSSSQSGTMHLSYWTLYHSWVLHKFSNIYSTVEKLSCNLYWNRKQFAANIKMIQEISERITYNIFYTVEIFS